MLDASAITTHISQGSRPPTGTAVGRHFDVLVLCAQEIRLGSSDFPGVEVVRAGIDDAELTEREARIATLAAGIVADRVRHGGQRVLVTCHMGLNRSGLVTALALHALTGCSGRACVARVQERRPGALSNKSFVAALERLPGFSSRRTNRVYML